MNGSSQLQILIENQRRAMRWYWAFASSVALLGLVIMTFALLSGSLGAESLKAVLGIGGGFISTISGFPIKEVRRCQDRLALYRNFQAQLTAASSDQDRAQIEIIVWDAVKSVAVSQ